MNLEIKVQRIQKMESDSSLKAFVDIVVNDSILIKGLKIIEGTNGVFVSMPQERGRDNKWYDSIRCLTEGAKEYISDVVLYSYQQA